MSNPAEDVALPSDSAWQALGEAAADPWRLLREAGSRRLLGLSCGRLPEELPLALGLQPWRLRPLAEHPVRAGELMQGFTCSLLQNLLHQGLSGRLSSLSGLTLASNTCDSMRGFPALWRSSGARPAPIFSLRLPARVDGGAAVRELLQAELAGWLRWLEELSGERLQPGRLEEVARLQNRVRGALRGLLALARKGALPYSLVEVASRGAEALPLAEAADRVEAALAAPRGQVGRSGPADRPRLALLGGGLEVGPLIAFLEARGAQVVDDDSCALGRRLEEGCDLDPDNPLADLAERFLRRPPCPVAAGSAARRIAELRERRRAFDLQGVLLLRYRGCEAHAFDNVALARALASEHLPCLLLELEPGEPVSAQAATRLEAFLEMLSGLPLE